MERSLPEVQANESSNAKSSPTSALQIGFRALLVAVALGAAEREARGDMKVNAGGFEATTGIITANTGGFKHTQTGTTNSVATVEGMRNHLATMKAVSKAAEGIWGAQEIVVNRTNITHTITREECPPPPTIVNVFPVQTVQGKSSGGGVIGIGTVNRPMTPLAPRAYPPVVQSRLYTPRTAQRSCNTVTPKSTSPYCPAGRGSSRGRN